jgi:molecular chaperone Hsp33
MVQKLTGEGGTPRTNGHDEDDAWTRAKLLAATVEDHELLDPLLAPERLLYRLFHEERVRAFDATALSAFCQCSRERVEQMLASFTEDDIADMVEEGRVKVTCEFCKSRYEFAADELLGKNTTLQ